MHNNSHSPLIVKPRVDRIELSDPPVGTRLNHQAAPPPRKQQPDPLFGTAEGRAAAKAGRDVTEIVNDPRPKIEIPASRNRLSSEFARDLGPILAKHEFFAKDSVPVCPDPEKASLAVITGRAFRTKIEDYIIPFRAVKTSYGTTAAFNRTISKEEAETILASGHFIKCLQRIRAVNNVRLPAPRADGRIELLAEGYDRESMLYTAAGGPQIEALGLDASRKFFTNLVAEFCFREEDRPRATAVAVAAALTLFCFNLIPRGAPRPGFLFTGNAEGTGKTLLARLAIIPRCGIAPIGPLPPKEEEIQKRIFSAALAGSPVLFFDNGKRHVSSGALESALTAHFIEGRVLGRSENVAIENMTTVFMTGNGATVSPDLRRRLLLVELFLREARAEDRIIKNPLDEAGVIALRPAILSALWGLTLAWAEAGQPPPQIRLPSYEAWSRVVGGILEHTGFASPVSPPRQQLPEAIVILHK